MTPNLDRLFEQAKHIDRYDGTDGKEIAAADLAVDHLRDLFDVHGETLVKALGKIRTIAKHQDTNVLDPFKWLIQISEEAEHMLAAM